MRGFRFLGLYVGQNLVGGISFTPYYMAVFVIFSVCICPTGHLYIIQFY